MQCMRPARKNKSKVARLGRRMPPIIVAAVHVAHRRGDEFLWIEIVEAREIDRHEIATDFRNVTPAEWRDRALAMRALDRLVGRERVAGQLLAREQAERVRFDGDAPPAQLPAIGAVTLAGAFGEVDVGLVADFSAAAAAVVRLLHTPRSL